MITPIDIGKLAGLYEGEGSFGIVTVKGHRSMPRLDFFSTDRDVVTWVANAVGASVLGPYRPSKASASNKTFAGKKPVWGTVAQGARAMGIAFTIYALLGERRRGKVREMAAAWRSRRLRPGATSPIWHRAARTPIQPSLELSA